MLRKIENALLLSDVQSFIDNYTELAEQADVNLTVESDWGLRYRVNDDVVILGSKYLSELNETYYPIAVLILKKNESPFQYIKKGITRFIFDYSNPQELLLAFYKQTVEVIHYSDSKLEDVLKSSCISDFVFGDYRFFFEKNSFSYKGKAIYLTMAEKRYLAEWLLHGNKDNKRRMILSNLRKRLGKEFLKDVDTCGQLKLINKE